MAFDISLITHTKEVLRLFDGYPVPEDAIATDVELRRNRPTTVDQVRTALADLRDRGEAHSRADSYGRTVWTITEKGKSAIPH
jgi:hypothetical protein